MIARALLAGWLVALALPAAAFELALKHTAEQTTMILTLRELIETGATGVPAALLATVLPGKGKVGDEVGYTRAEITRALGAAGERVRWRGAERVRVLRRAGHALAPDRYVDWARQALLAHLADADERIEAQAAGSYRALALPAGTAGFNARFAPASRRSAKVWLDISVDGSPYTSVAVAFELRRFRSAWVLRQPGSRHQLLHPAVVEAATVDVGTANGEPIAGLEQLQGQRLRRDFPAGRPLAAGDIEPRPAIASGAAVAVYANVGRVTVQTKAVAQRDGHIGQRIPVRTSPGNEALAVEVIGENRAIVSHHIRP